MLKASESTEQPLKEGRKQSGMEGASQSSHLIPTGLQLHHVKTKGLLRAAAAGGKRIERKEERGPPQLQRYCLSTADHKDGLSQSTQP